MSTSVGVRIQSGVSISVRDGARLNAILYLPPEHAGARPAVLAMTPYIAQTHHEQGAYFATHGYPFLAVDVRGRGDSDGTFHPLNDAADGYDVVEWLARQPYCNGRVAMWGASYLAYCQWAAAKERPPHLATIVPVAAACFGVDFPMRSNIFFSYAAQWLTLVRGRVLQDKVFADRVFWRNKHIDGVRSGIAYQQLDAFVGNPSQLFQEWVSHPHRDAYWDAYSPTPEQCAGMGIPILTVTGAYDADQPGALEHYRQHIRSASPHAREQHHLIIGPWNHAGCSMPAAEFGGIKLGPASLLDLRLLHRQWYAWVMEGAPKPEFLRKRVAYYTSGAEEWRYADELEEVTARMEPLYLRSTINPTDVFTSGLLVPEPPAAQRADEYVHDPRDLTLADMEVGLDPQSLVDQRLHHAAAGRQLVYHSAPFASDMDISGFFELSLWLSIDRPDTDLSAAVFEVTLDGTVVHLATDWLRARYRENARAAKLIDTTMPLRYDFKRFTFISRRIRQGHRLRLIVAPLASIHWQRNYNSDLAVAAQTMQDARVVRVQLLHDREHPSALYVPIGRYDG